MLCHNTVADILPLQFTQWFYSGNRDEQLHLVIPSSAYNQMSCHNWSVIVAQDRISTALPPSPDIPSKYMLSFFISPLQNLSHDYPWFGYLVWTRVWSQTLCSVKTLIGFLSITTINRSCFEAHKMYYPYFRRTAYVLKSQTAKIHWISKQC